MQYPYQYPPQGRPPMPPKPGMSALTITLLVIGGVLVLGGGGCLLLIGLAAVGASADDDHPQATATAATGTAIPPTSPAEPDDDDSPPVPQAAAPTAAAPPPAAPTGGNVTPIWYCNATGYVRTCGFAGVCSNINVFGMGTGTDRYLASNQAKMACEGQARARGGTTTCMVSCSVATKR